VADVRTIRVAGVGAVTLEEFEAMLSAWVNAGAPRPSLDGTLEERVEVLRLVAARGDAQIRAVVDNLLRAMEAR
jgi:hypothetical protein